MSKRLLLLLLLLLSMTPVMAVEYRDVNNQSVSGEFHLQHNVARVSFFKTIVTSTHIQQAGSTQLGKFFVRNNTRDGYKVTLSSLKKGSLAPSETSSDQKDGETPIPYQVSILKNGEIGTGISTDFVHESDDLNADFVTILSNVDNSVSSLTDAEFTLYVLIEDTENIMEMAGTYSDTITITYEDL